MGAHDVTEKRRAGRIQPYIVPCQLVQGRQRRGAYLTDLGLGGARVAIDGEPPLVGASVTLELRLGRQVARTRLRAAVQWVRAGDRTSHEFGLTFRALKAAELRALQAVVEDFQRRAAQIA